MAEIGVSEHPGPRPAWRPCPVAGGRAALLSRVRQPASAPPCPLPSSPHFSPPSGWLLGGCQDRCLSLLLLGLTRLITTFFPDVRGPVKSHLSRSASHSSRSAAGPAQRFGWLQGSLGCLRLLMGSLSSHSTPLLCCSRSHRPTASASLQPPQRRSCGPRKLVGGVGSVLVASSPQRLPPRRPRLR